jgi:hypothetical protein
MVKEEQQQEVESSEEEKESSEEDDGMWDKENILDVLEGCEAPGEFEAGGAWTSKSVTLYGCACFEDMSLTHTPPPLQAAP